MARSLEIDLLGELQVRAGGAIRPLPKSRKTRLLLVLLALDRRRHNRTALCELLWGETADPRAGLRWSLSKLREVLANADGTVIVADAQSVGIDWARADTDYARASAALEAASELPAEALVRLEAGFAATPFADLDRAAGADLSLWLATQREAFARLHHRILEALLERAAPVPHDALPIARKLVALNPLSHDENVRLLSLTHAVLGRREAQALLERTRTTVRDAGFSDAELLAAWRRLSPPRAIDLQPAGNLDEPLWSLPQKPSVAVLAFENLGHPSDDVTANGLAIDLTSRLANLRGLFVIARASSQRFALQASTAQRIGAQLGVRYLIQGAAQRSDRRLRVTVELIDATDGGEIWSDHFDRTLDDLFAVQDEVTGAIVAAIVPQIDQAEMERARRVPTDNLDAWECFHRAMWHTYRFTTDDTLQAHALFERAVSQDPNFARAYAGLSFSHFSKAFLDASDDAAGELLRALEFAQRSVAVDGRDAIGHWSLGRALYLNAEHDRAFGAIDHALAVNPNYAQGFYVRGLISAHAGLAGQSIPDLDMAQRLSPFDPLLFAMQANRAIAFAMQQRFDEAAAWAVRATGQPNAHFHIDAIAAACLELAGRHDDAVRSVRRVLAKHPRYTGVVFERSFPYRQPTQGRLMADALIRAGLPRGH